MTALETTLYHACSNALEKLTARHIGIHEYMDLMNDLRRAVIMAENVQFGCSAGKHRTRCACNKSAAKALLNSFKS